ncbi:MAG: hypothetical protein IID35_00395 [Planctomycetes bacterium]|nr:hypothetical protein [Planctomycetota bacterium]
MPGRGFRAGFRATSLCLVLGAPILILVVAYATYDAQIVTDLLFVYLFLLLPLGFLLLGYSVAQRWLRGAIALAYLAASWVTFAVLDTVTTTGEPRSAVHWFCALYGLQIISVAFVIAVSFGLIFVPRRTRPGHCQECAYNLHGLADARCPECGTTFDPLIIEKETR